MNNTDSRATPLSEHPRGRTKSKAPCQILPESPPSYRVCHSLVVIQSLVLFFILNTQHIYLVQVVEKQTRITRDGPYTCEATSALLTASGIHQTRKRNSGF